ncbi:MAG: putative peptidoglycan lipid II flippase, partial [Oceanospirillaceae bacterium]
MRRSISIGIVVILQLLATVATQLLVIRIVGVGGETDAYIAAQTLPAIASAIIITALQSAWLPRLSVLLGNISSWRNEQSVAQGQGLLLGAGIIIFIYLLLPVLTPLVFPGFKEEQVQRTILFSGPLMLAAIFNIQTALLTVALRARDKFIVAELIAMFAAILGMVGVIFLLPQYGLEAVVFITLIRSVIVYVIQMYFASWPVPSLIKGWQCKATWTMMKPLLLGASLYKTSPLVDRYFLSQATSGGITVYSLAQTVMGMGATVLERMIAMPLIPSFSRYIEKLNYEGLKVTYRQSLYRTTIVVFLIGSLFFLLKPIIIMILIQLLDLNQEMSENIWWICVLLLGYLHVAVSGTIAVAVFYAFGDSKTPVKIGVFGFITSLFLKLIGFNSFGLYGLALATSAYYLINMLALNFLLGKKV